MIRVDQPRRLPWPTVTSRDPSTDVSDRREPWRRRGGGFCGERKCLGNRAEGSGKRDATLPERKEAPPGLPGVRCNWSGTRDLNLLRRLMLTGRRDTRIPTTALSHSGFGAPLLRTSPQPSAPVA